jgi:hypothetical protein
LIRLDIKIIIPTAIERIIIPLVLLYRRLRYGYPFRRIPLTRGKYAIVDPQDYPRLAAYNWHTRRSGRTFYACRNASRANGGPRRNIWMHSEVMPPPPGYVIDHINHRGLDNRNANLRPATPSQNACNRRFPPPAKHSTFRGVGKRHNSRLWKARIAIDRKVIELGYFENEIDAARAYDRAAKKYHGQFAILNFPE